MKPSTYRLTAVAVVIWSLALWPAPGMAQYATTLSYGPAAAVGMDTALLDQAVQPADVGSADE